MMRKQFFVSLMWTTVALVGPQMLGAAETVTQDVSVGYIRALVTRTVSPSLGIPICWGPSTDAVVLSAEQALSALDESGISAKDAPETAVLIDILKKNPKFTAIRVTEDGSGNRHELLVLPERGSIPNVRMLELSPGAAGDVCVSCTDQSGQLSPCKCTTIVRRACGKDPVVSCVGECTYCPKGGGVPPEKPATDICGTITPWSDTTSYATLVPGSKL